MKVSIHSDFTFSVQQLLFDGELLQLVISSDAQRLDKTHRKYDYCMNLGDGTPQPRPAFTLVEYLQKYVSLTRLKPNTTETYRHVERYLHLYGDVCLEDITTEYLQNFVSYLESSELSRGTVYLYFSKLKCVLHHAYKNGLFDERILLRVMGPKREQHRKIFLTESEIQKIARVDIPDNKQNIRDMFLFSCFSGLRFGDVARLKRKDINRTGSGMTINFLQQKTSTYESLPLSEQARQIILSRGSSGQYVFDHEDEPQVNSFLKQLAKRAKIKKNISFHSARHSFCVMLLTHDVPIYTVQKLMCHADIRSTNVYADIMNSAKSRAVKKLPVLDGVRKRKTG